MLVVHTEEEGEGASRAPGERPEPPAFALPSPAQPPTEPDAGPGGAERPGAQAERPGYERRPHARFFAIYGLLVGIVTTCVALLFALVIDTEPDLDGRPDTTLPTAWPSGVPTDLPTGLPSGFPTDLPTGFPTGFPTDLPTEWPTGFPTDFPTEWPTGFPTYPSGFPTDLPTGFPTGYPTSPTFPTIDPSIFSDFPTDGWTPPTELFGEPPEAP